MIDGAKGIFFTLVLCCAMWAPAQVSQPAFRVDVPYPTKDKPQSKLWFARGSWWAWLPVQGGSSIWRRTEAGWRRQTTLDYVLRDLPGQADVWAERDKACAVLVEPLRLAVMCVEWDEKSGGYRAGASAVQFRMAEGAASIETATIARDGSGRWWIAYDHGRKMWARASLDRNGREWTGPMAVSTEPAADDDICAIVALPGGVGVIWSDQIQDAVFFRRRSDQAPPDRWDAVEPAARGGYTADDHINSAVAEDGALYVATKNSLDRIGQPQLVLRVRDPRGRWTAYPYAPRTEKFEPSRPIVLLGGKPPRLTMLHSVYLKEGGRTRGSSIAMQTTELPRIDLAGKPRTIIHAGTGINDATGSKAPLPTGQPWIVLASDSKGNVYEAWVDE